MEKRIRIILLMVSGVILIVAGWYSQRWLSIDEPPIERTEITLRYGVNITNNSNEFIEKVEVEVFAPIEKTPWQELVGLEASQPYSMRFDSQSNPMLEFVVDNIPPYSTRDIVITARLLMASSPAANTIIADHFLTSTKYVELEAPIVKQTAVSFKSLKVNEKAHAIHQWMNQSIEYKGYMNKNHGAEFVLSKKYGDCTEFMFGFIALSRAVGLPAIGYAGFTVGQGKNLLQASDYHNWAGFHDGERWRISDSQKNIFDKKYNEYVVFKVLNDGADTVRFRSTDQRLSVKMI